MNRKRVRHCLAVVICLGAAGLLPAQAHIVAYPANATAGASVDLRLRVPHGCEGSATVALRLKVPDGLTAVKPRLKPGWRITVKHRASAPATTGSSGHGASEAVDEIEWRGGPLPNGMYDDFELTARLPATPGRVLLLPTVQECEQGLTRWIEPPAPKAGQSPPEHPAPAIRLR
jgi:uncharacterized protein YcnI